MRRRTPPQKRISQSKARFNVAVWARQTGKTTFGLDKLIEKPIQGRPEGIYWHILQTHTAAEIGFNRYWKLFDGCRELLAKKPNESERFFQLVNGATVFFKSGEVFEDLRAETLDGCIIDEVRQQRAELWPRVIRPMLSRRQGWCDFLSTPNGYDHFFDLYEFARKDASGEWATFHAPATECWWWTPEEIASAKSIMSEAEFAQEIMAEFRDLRRGKTYIGFSQLNLRDTNPFVYDCSELSPYLPVIVACDFNLSPMSWTLGQERNGDFYFFDEIFLKGSNTQEASLELVHRLNDIRDGGYIRSKPQVIIAGDATSKSGQRAAAGKSDYDILCAMLTEAGFSWSNKTPDSNPAVKDRVNALNAKLKDASGGNHLWINPKKCPKLVRDLERVTWKEGASATLDKSSDLDLTHSSDGIGYAVCAISPIPSSVSVGKMRVILR